jgi:hypothetical protein
MPVDIVSKSGWISAVACDISEAGVRLKSRDAISPDTNVSIRFKGQKESHFTGSVVWTATIPETNGFRYYLGIEFKVIIFADDRIMEMPSKAEMVCKVIAEIKKVGGAIRKQQ